MRMLERIIGHRDFVRLAALPLAVALAGCTTSGGTQEDKMGRFLVPQEKYTLYNCAQLAQTAETVSERERELVALIAKAGPGAGGSLVASIAYQPEYYQVHGDMNELRRTAAEKNCKFVPGAEKPGMTAAGKPVRRR